MEGVVALDDEEVRAALTPEHRVELRTSIATANTGSQVRNAMQQHGEDLAAWRARDTAARAEMEDLLSIQQLVAWGLVPAGVLLPGVMAAGANGWDPISLVSTLPELPTLPMSVVMLGALVGGSVCAVLASRARRVSHAWKAAAGAVVAGTVLLLAARSLPLYIAANAVIIRSGQALEDVVVRIHPNSAGASFKVLRGNDTIRRGEVLNYTGSHPVRFLHEGR